MSDSTIIADPLRIGDPASQDATTREIKHGSSREEASKFLNHFIAFVKARKLYAEGHARLVHRMGEWKKACATLHDRFDEIDMLIKSNSIYVNRFLFELDTPLLTAFAPELIRRLIRFISIGPGVMEDELNALAELLLEDPETLAARGGARSALRARHPEHIRLYEFSYDMENTMDSEEDFELVRLLARYEYGEDAEGYVIGRLNQMNAAPKDRARLRRLLSSKVLSRDLEKLRELIDETTTCADLGVHASDLLIHLVKSLEPYESLFDQEGDHFLEKILEAVVRGLRERLEDTRSTSSPKADLPRKELLDQVAERTLSTPAVLIEWLSLDVNGLGLELSDRQSDALKTIFARPEGENRKIRFGNTEIEALKITPTRSSRPAPSKRDDLPTADTLEGIAEAFDDLASVVKGSCFRLQADYRGAPHLDTLIELYLHEKKPEARARIHLEMAEFLTRCLADQDTQKVLPDDWTSRLRKGLNPSDLPLLFRTSSLCEVILRRHLEGGEDWGVVLGEVSKEESAAFAGALGRILTREDSTVTVADVADYIPHCQDKLVSWLFNVLNGDEPPPPHEKIMVLLGTVHSERIVPLVEIYLKDLDPDDGFDLLEHLIAIDTPQAARVVCAQLARADEITRESVIHLLGRSRQSIAEQTLMRLLEAPSIWSWKNAHETMAALNALKLCGTEKSLVVIEALIRRWWMVLTSPGRQTRNLARETLTEVNERIATPDLARGEEER